MESFRVLKKGGVFVIHDPMIKSRYGDMDAFIKKLKGLGYPDVKLISREGKFLTKKEEFLNGIAGSAVLVGRKG